jgi:hypothetical protein
VFRKNFHFTTYNFSNVVVYVCDCEMEWAWVAGERNKKNELKNGRPKGTVKAVWQKTGMAN